MKKFGVIFLSMIALALTFYSCKKENTDKPGLQDGIYIGKFNEFAVAYKVTNNKVEALGYSFSQKSIVLVDDKSFVAVYGDNYSPKSTVCFKTVIKEGDFENAVVGTNKEFNGLHYALNPNDIANNNGLIFSIKSLTDTKLLVTIMRMDNSYRYQTEAIVSTEANISNGAISHRKITFNVVPEITNQNTEIWSMTLNPITSYQWSNLFTLYSNNQERFQIEVINNGAK